jgi:uncharacterized protein YdeI (YjbR/CyaY-like superfamily)
MKESMSKNDPRIDTYIARSADFAKPILNHIRSLVHKGCPEVQETIKWGFPHFDYKGIMCSMAAFKQHAVFGFWKEKLILGTNPGSKGAMGSFGRLTSVKDLPSDAVFIRYIKKAMELNVSGVRSPIRPAPKEKTPLKVPSYFTAALKKNQRAQTVFKSFSYSNRRDYVEWVTEAKTKETRNRRLATAVEWMSVGKVRNWKYIKK